MSRTVLTDIRLMAEVTHGIAEGTLSPHYRHIAAQKGLISFLAYRKPGTRGRAKLISVLTEKGRKFYEQNRAEVDSEIKSLAA